MARRVSDYRIRRIADRGNEEDGPDSRARGDRSYRNRSSADRGNEKVDRDPGNISEIKGLRRRVRDLEIQHEIRHIRKRIRELELQREMRKETESRYVVRDDVNEEEEYPSFDSYPRFLEPIYPDFVSEDEPRFDEDEVDIDIDEGERLFLEQAFRWIPEGVPMARNDGIILTFEDIERNEGEKGLVDLVDGTIRVSDEWSYENVNCGKFVESNLLVEGDGPTVVTGGPVSSVTTLPFVPEVRVDLLVEARFTNLNMEGDLIKSPIIIVGSPINFKWQNKDNIMVAKNADKPPDFVDNNFIICIFSNDGTPCAKALILMPCGQQRKGDEASNWVMEPHANNDTVDLGLYVKNDFFNKIGLVDCGPQDQMGRKDYEGPPTTSLDVLNSLSSKIATTKCVGADLFERFKLIANSDRSNAPYDPGGTGLGPSETTREVELFRQAMVTIINGSRVDVPFDPGDFAP
ncbi:hypothetical protein LXL04_032586 [Taraxacum kok-saghyz]